MKINITISQTLSYSTSITVPSDFNELEKYVKEQVQLPSELCKDWTVDDFCINYDN